MIVEVKYKGELINKKDIEVTWSDCFGEHRVDSLEGFIRQYTDEQVVKEIAEENIVYEDMGYIETLNYHQLEHLLMINKGRNNFIINRRR